MREVARILRKLGASEKNRVLEKIARGLVAHSAVILKENAKDLKALDKKATPAFRDRLTLDEKRLAAMAESLRQVAALPDPVGELVDRSTLPNGLKLRRVRAPLGVIFMIYESRPNVATEAFSLAFKAGNAAILRGGRESARTVAALYQLIADALAEEGLPRLAAWGVTDPDRALVKALLRERAAIDVVVPRGGDRLIEFVVNESLIPVIKNDRGLCHVYLHEDLAGEAKLSEMGLRIAVNAKTQRPGVCNSMETLLVHEKCAVELLPRIYDAMAAVSVEWRACPRTKAILKGRSRVIAAKSADWDTEHLDFIMNCRVVNSLAEAIGHIEKHGSRHSECIVTGSHPAAALFQEEIDAAAVYWNASTRFTDGFEFGLGGELGISTQKLHVRGPVGLRELTCPRWVIEGEGQIRS